MTVADLPLMIRIFLILSYLNFGLHVDGDKVELYFHCAKEGTKLDLIRQDNRATFEMDCGHRFIMYEERMSCTMGYESVIGHGTIEFVPTKINLMH